MSVPSSTATVWHGGGRRYFSKKAAERAEAKSIIRRRCECESSDPMTGYPGYRCNYHEMEPHRFQRMVHLLIVMFVRKVKP